MIQSLEHTHPIISHWWLGFTTARTVDPLLIATGVILSEQRRPVWPWSSLYVQSCSHPRLDGSFVASDVRNWDIAIAMYLRAQLTGARLRNLLFGSLAYYKSEITSSKGSYFDARKSFFKRQLPFWEYTFSHMASIVDLKSHCYLWEIEQHGQIYPWGLLQTGRWQQHYVVSLYKKSDPAKGIDFTSSAPRSAIELQRHGCPPKIWHTLIVFDVPRTNVIICNLQSYVAWFVAIHSYTDFVFSMNHQVYQVVNSWLRWLTDPCLEQTAEAVSSGALSQLRKSDTKGWHGRDVLGPCDCHWEGGNTMVYRNRSHVLLLLSSLSFLLKLPRGKLKHIKTVEMTCVTIMNIASILSMH